MKTATGRRRTARRGRFLGLLLCAIPAAAQTDIQWSAGQDFVGQFRAQIRDMGTNGIATPSSAVPAPRGAGEGLVIDATEIGTGKAHRRLNAQHPYPPGAWIDHISPSDDLSATPIVSDDADGAVSIQFSNLEQLLRAVVAASRRKGARVSVLNVNAHGFPGAMLYPMDRAQQDGARQAAAGGGCASWYAAAAGPEGASGEGGAFFPSKDDILLVRGLASADEDPGDSDCMSGPNEWRTVAARIPDIKDYFADDAQIHIQACLVGLGAAGDKFTKTVAELLLAGKKANVQTALSYGLMSWSIPEGLAFWDYVDDQQYARDTKLALTDADSRALMQKGSIRVASYSDGRWITTIATGQDFMPYGRAPLSLPSR